METGKFAESALGFTKSPLGIIALFIVLVYGFASLVVGLGSGLSEHVVPLIYFMVFFPVLVFVGFLWLVAKHHNKLYGPSDFKNEDNYIKAQMASAASLGAASAKQPENSAGVTETQLREIVNVVSNVPRQLKHEKWRNRILWVDDRPENNVYERQAFEAQGIEFSLALSTDEALELLKTNKFAAIISDMGRKEGPQEGYVLLEKLRSMGDQTPFIIYAASNLPEHKKMARERGAIGSTNRADELFQTVMSAVTNGS
ncbi:response regulator [Acidithiobacillus concretivorus]|uniref:Response regulator n=1 Tax=Acidithiobacillus concretivorus TaxID=3063952 RepID=A0ABS5ZS92_9PROT|nr:response regulator [Acidithiobacillus concretivorus]MBU2739377.1 response regulator [Acidithiobacillus concretivorus]